jgi:hypothetical protein
MKPMTGIISISQQPFTYAGNLKANSNIEGHDVNEDGEQSVSTGG